MDGFCGRPFFQIFMKSSKIPFIMYLKKNYLPSGRKEKNRCWAGRFLMSKRSFQRRFCLFKAAVFISTGGNRRTPPCDYGEIGTCQKKPDPCNGAPYPGLRK